MAAVTASDAPADLDDHALAAWLATTAGERLLAVRESGPTGRELKDAGDRAAHELLMELLAEHRPGDSVLSEEGKDDKRRLNASRVWIVDPLDGTREFSEPPRDDWAVHVALWQDGELTAGAVAQPALRETFDTGRPPVVPPRTQRAYPDRGVAHPAAGLRGGPGRGDRRRAGPDGLGGGQGDLGRARRQRCLRARGRAVRVGQRRTRGGGSSGGAVLLARGRLGAALQPGRRVPARPDRVPAGAVRSRSSSSYAVTAPTEPG